MLGSGNNLSRGNAALSSSSSDIPPLSQCLCLDLITLGSQKYTRSGELRRALGVPPATTQEDHSFGVTHFKLTAPVATEELKHFKESVQDTSRKAKDRVRKLREAIDKLEKYREALSSKKGQRTDISPTERAGGVNLAKIGSQVHRNENDILNQRPEDRAKNVGLNKRVRTSVADVQGDNRAVVNARQQKGAEKDGDTLSSINGSAVRTEEKIRRLPAGGEGWDTKKKKRSAGIVGHRVANGDQDVKRAMQQKINPEPKLRSCDVLGFRSKSSPGVSGIHKLDGSFEPAGSDAGTALRNEPESIPLPRDRTTVLEQRVVAKGSNKASLLDDNLANSPNRMLKAKVSRAPRTSSIMVLDSSSNSKIHQSSGAFPSWEQPASVNKIPALAVGNNKKYAMPIGSSSHAMAQWVGQRPNKNSRTKRANLVSPVSNLAEPQISSQSFATPDFSARTSFGVGGSVFASSVDNVNLKVKKEPDTVSSPFGLSESEESGAGDNKLKDKAIESGEVAVSMAGVLLTRKNKISTGEIGDGANRSGRFGSSAPLTRPAHPIREKSENLQATKPIQTARSSSDKHKSKTGRPPSKKMRDCKASTRVGSSLNAVSSDLTGESDDDQKELFTAASSAHNASSLACSGSFWKKMELIFANISLEDASRLKQQLSSAEDRDESLSQIFGAECNVLGVLTQKETPNCYGEGSAKANSEGRVDIKKLDKVTPLYQRVLSALIEEDENDEFYHHFEGKSMSLHYASDDSHCGSCNQLDIEPKDRDKMESEVESNADFQSQKSSFLDGLSCNISVASNTFRNSSMSNSLHSSEQWLGDDGFSHSDVGPISEICSHDPAHPQSKETNVFSVSSSDIQYQFMSLDEKILLELHGIGLYPETLPDLAEGEEAINQKVMELNEQLYQQVQMKKRKLGKVDKAIQNNRDVERRNVEHVAMDQLIQIAYRKRVPCRGGNSSKSAVRKVPKQVALAFINRTLARCRKFEEAGISCFSDPVLQDVMFAAPPCSNDAKSTDCVGSGTASNTFNETSNQQTEARASGAVSSTFERYDSSDALPSVHSSEHGVSRHGFMLKRKREVLIDDVVGSASSRITSSLEGHVNVGIRGKRSERERDQSRENLRNGSVSGAGASLDSFKSERKAKTKPKQKNSNLSTSGNGVQPGYPDAGGSSQQSMANASNKSGEVRSTSMSNFPRNSTKDAGEPIDFSKLNELDVAEELGGNQDQDLGSWLNELDGLQDIDDAMGLEIPMDDLSDLKFAF
ncbi:hypothetical protein SLEP1_g43259 [Rubroshorea leprosula]|uniref:Uncharacterized protein n=1 Tax=Rubroshorea leprosula TaxID=152421 RepID=A0AAV5LCE0_9ROSI|nr:hypothetical protein SLEP1_g43259 [Rubroshorea leprosula]